MKVATFLTIKAVVSLFFGILLALVPGVLMALFGVTLDPADILMARLTSSSVIL